MSRFVPSLLLCFSLAASAEPTVILDPAAADRLMGAHVFNLQWIDQPAGVATVSEPVKGELRLVASQENGKGDVAAIEGRITKVTERTFELEGTISTTVSYLNGGRPCVRDGHFTFKVSGKRPYWRLQEMKTCDSPNTVDYLDVYFARPKGPKKT